MMNRKQKIKLINELEEAGVLRELMPVSFDWRDTAYWHWEVLNVERLPIELVGEYHEFGELRW
jgi:hypothetical protein